MRAICIGLSAGLLCASAYAAPVTLYSQGFDTPDTSGTTSLSVTLYGWEAHRSGNGARTLSGSDSSNWGGDPLASGGSGGGRQVRVVDDPAAPSTSNRIYSYFQFAEDVLVWTDSFSPIAPSAYTTLTVGYSTRADAAVGFRAAVRIFDGVNSTWYASGLAGHSGSAVWSALSFDLKASIWNSFAFDGTQTTNASAGFDATGAFASLLGSGTITGAGIYYQMPNVGNARYDSFFIEGEPIPEPGAMALLLALPAALLRRR